ECVLLDFDQEIMVDVPREIVARKFGALAAVLRAVVNKLKEVDAFGGIGVGVAFIVGVFEIITERVSSQAEQKPGCAGAFDRLSREHRLGLEHTEAGQCEAALQCRFQEISASEGLHGPSNTTMEDFCQSWFCAPPCGEAESTTAGLVHPRSVGCAWYWSGLTGTRIEPEC